MKLRSVVLAAFLALPFVSFAQVGVSINVAPPVMPVYEQPACPVEGYMWTPGYWAYDADYYWVPGVWVAPPAVGLLWTPPWWGWSNGAYAFNEGYWGPTVGFYGGINYGHGYWGDGYWGGHWSGNNFQYNTAITNVNKTVIHNTYIDKNVMSKNVNHNRAAFNGPNGVKAEANAEQKAAAANAKKVGPTSQQLKRQETASKDPNLQAKNNKGHPNNEAIKSFDKREGTEHGNVGEGVGAGGEAGAGKGEKNKTGNMAEHHGQGAGMSGEEHGPKHEAEDHGNKHERENVHGNNHTAEGNQAKMHKGTEHADAAHGRHTTNQQMMHHQQQMNAQRHQQQMAMQHHQPMQGGGNRPKPSGQQQQGKKKPNQY
jgi:hypothetical protein